MYLFFPEITHLLMKKANPNALSKRNTFGFAWYGAPSGTRTQDPLIKSQLLSQVASSRGVEDSITPTDSGFYIYSFKLCCF